jgi:cell division protease FtsH
VFAGSVSTGAADDLQRATEIAIEMVAKHGMDETIGQAPTPRLSIPSCPALRVSACKPPRPRHAR